MPSDVAMNIVNKLFTGSKDLSTEVDKAMMAVSATAIDAKKQEMAKSFLDTPPEPEEEISTDETDNGND
tara:strand:- start:2283 stop:2489 length:207 start_codon:yes stop_codon:yes gene_type:complete